MKYNTPEQKTKFYTCYSPKLYEFLIRSGFETIDEYRHLETGKKAFVFILDNKIKPYIDSWSRNKK